ncbi:unnamed protein product [Rhizoctonia solani]|uniref:endo-polygalacturonase n=1 Tax=Rhizoctonia solani TaxID=456999 RepID=A0A8H3B9Y1_9AGAM|nr:unnamed protein product [Rhizoctonia solani]
MLSSATALSLLSLAPALLASPSPVQRCTGTISSLDDVADAIKCTTININSFTVPAGKTFQLDAPSGATVNLLGDVTFGVSAWAGPLFQLTGTSITFNGNGHTFNGQGEQYWDGLGSSGTTKPHPMMKIKSSGTFSNVVVKNSPQQCFSFGNSAALTVSKVTVDNSAGDAANSKSSGKAAGHNTDGFDVSVSNLTIEDSTVHNQDDCLAINKGSNIIFQRNTCTGGHGISVGSIDSDVTVSGVQILNNVVTDNDNGLRIKTKAAATGSTVSGITYTGNTVTGCKKYGVIIDQSYPDTLGTPGTGVKLSGVTFSGTNTVAVASGAKEVEVNCGSGSCTGTWNWSGLKVSGGSAGAINYSGITGHVCYPMTTMSAIVQKELIVKDDPRQPECHASTLVVVRDYVLAAWFGGEKEGRPDVKIWLSKRNRNGQWSQPRVVAAEDGITHWNPVLFTPNPTQNPDRVILFYKTGTPIPRWKTWMIESMDGGENWSPRRELVYGDESGGRGPVKNPVIVLANGDWVSGASVEVTLPNGKGVWDAFCDISPAGPEQGTLWIRSPLIPMDHDNFKGEGIIQPSLWESTVSTEAGTAAALHMLTRSSNGWVCRSDSLDNGRTWSPAYSTVLPNNNSGLCVTKMRDGRLVCVHNPVGGSWGPRTPLVASISADNGVTWERWAVLEDQPPPKEFTGVNALETGIVSDGQSEFSYPTVIPTPLTEPVGVLSEAFTVNAAQARALKILAKSKNLFLMEAVWTRFFPLVKSVQQDLTSGVIGEIKRVYADFGEPYAHPIASLPPSHRMLSPALAGGTLHDLFPYPLFWALITLYHLPANERTPPSQIAASSTLYHETGVDVQTTAILNFSKIGAQAILSSSLEVPTPKDQVILVQGTKGDLVVPLIPPGRPTKYYIRVRKEEKRNADYDETAKTFDIPGHGLFWEADECARCLARGEIESSRMPLDESILAMDILDEIRKQVGIEFPPDIESAT